MHTGQFDASRRPLVLIGELTQACDHCRADATLDRHPEELSTTAGEQDEVPATGTDGELPAAFGR